MLAHIGSAAWPDAVGMPNGSTKTMPPHVRRGRDALRSVVQRGTLPR